MFEVYPSNWPVAVDTTDPRNQFHETAMHEARIATDFRQYPVEAVDQPSIVTRLRLAIAGGPAAAEPCNCPA